jgi:hypothetical protein
MSDVIPGFPLFGLDDRVDPRIKSGDGNDEWALTRLLTK